MSSVNGIRPIRDPGTARICNLAGLNKAHKSLVTLRDIDRGTELALKEVDAARTKAQFYDKALVVARFTKATCDAFISLAAEFSGTKGESVSTAYDALSVGAGVVGNVTAGNKIDKISLTTETLKAGAGYAGDHAGYLIKSVAVKGELVRNAMNADQKEVLKSGIEYSTDLATYTLDQLKAIEANTKTGKGAGAASKFIKIGKAIFSYNDNVAGAFDEYLKDNEATASSFDTQKQVIKSSGDNIRRQIRALEDFVTSCEAEMNENTLQLPPLARNRNGAGRTG